MTDEKFKTLVESKGDIALVQDTDEYDKGLAIVKDKDDGYMYLLDFYDGGVCCLSYEIGYVEELIKKAKEELIRREKRQ